MITMIKIIFSVLVALHGLIHLMGFAKAFQFAEMNQLTQPISRFLGLIWLLATLLFLSMIPAFLFNKDWWWMIALAAIICSQVLIFLSWQDAKFGTIANVTIFIFVVIGYGQWSFGNSFQDEVKIGLQQSSKNSDSTLTETDVQSLPEPIRKYLHYTGSIGKPKVNNFKVKFTGKIRKDERSEWMPFTSEQYNFQEPSTRLFFMNAMMKHLPVAGFINDVLKKEDVEYLVNSESEFLHYFPITSNESRFISEQTIEANRLQTYRDPAQQELAEWIRFSSKDADKYRDGLTTASMEIEGVPGWMVRNFYGKDDVLKTHFREKGLEKVKEQVSKSAGWILITSKDESVATLLETGKRMQRLFLKVREKNLGIHPMTQILEEPSTKQILNQSIGIRDNVQFILRTGYLKNYPPPVSLRRPVAWFVDA